MLENKSSRRFDAWLIISFLVFTVVLTVGAFEVVYGYISLFVYCIFLVLKATRRGFYGLITHYSAIGIYATLATAFQISEGFEFWGFGAIQDKYYYLALILVCLYCFSYELGYHLSGADKMYFGRVKIFRLKKNDNRDIKFIAASLVFFGLALLLIYTRPDLSIELRGYQTNDEGRAVSVFFFAYLPKLFIWALCAISGILTLATRSKRYGVLFLFAAASALIWAGPQTTARQVILVGALPLLYYAATLTYPIILPIVIWVGVLFVGPALNYFSRDYLYGVETRGFPFSPDFDAMYIVSALIERIDYFPLGFGRYLLSAFSFFLQRELKLFIDFDPLNREGGAVFSQTNVSTPPFFTAFLDFWFLGPIILGLAIGAVMGWAEIFRQKKYSSGNLWFLLPFVSFSSYVPFVRGPILGWGPYILAGLISYGILIWIFYFFSQDRRG